MHGSRCWTVAVRAILISRAVVGGSLCRLVTGCVDNMGNKWATFMGTGDRAFGAAHVCLLGVRRSDLNG
jgi:hypothetical protein